MKRFILLAAFGVAGMMSAKTAEVKNSTTSLVEKTVVKDECQWCVLANGNQYCAEAATCGEAKDAARKMAIAEITPPPTPGQGA